MAHNRAYYETLAQRSARDKRVEHPRLKEGSWQHKVFHNAYENERAAIQIEEKKRQGRAVGAAIDAPADDMTRAGASGGPNIQNMPRAAVSNGQSPYWRENIAHLRRVHEGELAHIASRYAGAACEHIMLLAAEHNEEHDLKRRARLHRSIGRVMRRHEKRSVAFGDRVNSVPMFRPAVMPA